MTPNEKAVYNRLRSIGYLPTFVEQEKFVNCLSFLVRAKNFPDTKYIGVLNRKLAKVGLKVWNYLKSDSDYKVEVMVI